MSVIELRLPRSAVEPLLRAIEARLRELSLEIEAARKRIGEYEARYGLTSREFLERYEKGELGDDEDFVAWYGELMFLAMAEHEYKELLRVMNDTRRGLSKTGQ